MLCVCMCVCGVCVCVCEGERIHVCDNLIIFLREVPESGVILRPMVADIFSQWRGLRPGLQSMCTTGRYSWGVVCV